LAKGASTNHGTDSATAPVIFPAPWRLIVSTFTDPATSFALPFRRLWYAESNAISNAIFDAKFFSRSHPAVIRVYDEARNVIETHEHTGDFKEW